MSRTPLIIVLLTGLLAAPAPLRAEHVMVLVTNEESTLDTLSPVDLRKLYLGFIVSNDEGRPIHPATNSSDPLLWEIFLQDVMGMSARSYDRRLLTLTLQSGRHRPDVYEELDDLLQRIERDVDTVTFVWEEDIGNRDGIKILRVLWHH